MKKSSTKGLVLQDASLLVMPLLFFFLARLLLSQSRDNCHVPFLFVPVTIILTFFLTSTYFIYFHLPFLTYPLIFQTLCLFVFCPPSSVHTLISHCLFPSLVFHPMFLCSISIIIFPPSVHYSLPSLSNLDNLTFHPLWLCESSFTFSVLHRSPYYSEPCSIKFLPILVLAPQLVIVIYLCKNTTHLCLLCLSRLRTPLFLGKGTTHKLKPSPLVSLCYPHTSHLITIHHSFPCPGILLGVLPVSLICLQMDYNSITSSKLAFEYQHAPCYPKLHLRNYWRPGTKLCKWNTFRQWRNSKPSRSHQLDDWRTQAPW